MAESTAIGGRANSRQALPLLVLLAISLALNIALGIVVVSRGLSASAPGTGPNAFNPNAWYGVFVGTQEAFVGHITDISGTDISMRDLYYLTYEAKDDKGQVIPNPQPSDIKPSLKKLGQEVWGPKDFVHVNRQNMRYFTELRPDSPIVTAINAYQKPGPAPSPTK